MKLALVALLCALTALPILLPLGALAEDQKKKLWLVPGDRIIGHLADGQGWTSSIILVNMQNVTRRATIYALDNNGNDLFLRLKGGDPQGGSQLSVTLPPRGSLSIETDGTSFPLKEGWAIILPDDGDLTPLGGYIIFRYSQPGLPDREAVVPVGNWIGSIPGFDPQQTVPFNERDGFFSGMALANPSPSQSMTLNMNFYDENGLSIISRQLTLGPWHHTSFLFSHLYPELAGRAGVLKVSVANQLDLNYGPIIVGLRFNPGGSFTTMFPMRLR